MTDATPRPEAFAEREVAFRMASIRVGVALTALAGSGSTLYALATWERPHRAILLLLAGASLLSVPIVLALPRERIVRGRWREPFFVLWTAVLIGLIAGATAADGGIGSPYRALFILPLIFAGLSYPPMGVAITGTVAVLGFTAVALTIPGQTMGDAFIGFALVCGAVMCTWQARNRKGQEGELVATADALRRSEERTRLREAQQEQIAMFGQRALAGVPVGRLMIDMLRTVQRTLDVDLAAVLKLADDGDHFTIVSAVGYPEEVRARARVPSGRRSQAGYTLITGSPVIVGDWSSETRFAQAAVLQEIGAVSGLTVPIRGRSGPFGVLGLQSLSPRSFDQDDVSFLQSMANVLASAIERRGEEEDARHRALHDPLTGLPNRALFTDHLARALARQERSGGEVAVIFLDLDRFKLVNDSLGHQAGDQLLKLVAPRLSDALRPGDIVARFGGDEFAILLDEIKSERDATAIAERIAVVLAKPFVIEGRKHFVTASLGIAFGAGEGLSEALIRDADVAMYRAKELGRARYEIFDEALRFRLAERLQVENELRAGVERDELRVHYQPVVSLASGSIVGAEALVRWAHPERGLLAPGDFIEIAEESGLIVPIGRWVLEEACRRAAAWHRAAPDAPPLEISVNVSPLQVADPRFPGLVERVLRSTGIEPGSVSLELTESLVMERTRESLVTLEALKELGVRLVLDDFGTGYSSLGYLKGLPFDSIKLDRTFVGHLGTDRADDAIVTALVALGQTLGLTIVAEGVETAEQVEIVRELGCQYAQGFYFSHPVAADVFEGLLGEPLELAARG